MRMTEDGGRPNDMRQCECGKETLAIVEGVLPYLNSLKRKANRVRQRESVAKGLLPQSKCLRSIGNRKCGKCAI